MLTKPSPVNDAHTVPVLRKALRVFETVATSRQVETTKSIAAKLEISPTTCYRILQSFVAENWLCHSARGSFELSFGLMPFLHSLLRKELLIEIVQTPLARLAETTGLTAKLTVLQGDDAVTIHSANSPKDTAITSRVGSVVSLAVGSSGAVYLSIRNDEEIETLLDSVSADLWKTQTRDDVLNRVREVRLKGVAFDKGSYQIHINTLSAPLYSIGDELVGAITLLGFPQDFEGTARTTLIRELKATAGNCSELIQGRAISDFS